MENMKNETVETETTVEKDVDQTTEEVKTETNTNTTDKNKEPSWLAERLQRQEKKIRAEYADYESLKGQVSEKDNTISSKDTEIAELKRTIAKYEIDSVKTKVAYDLGIPAEFVDRLQGTTEEEIRTDAENIKKMFSIGKPAPLRSTETPGPTSVDGSLLALSRKLTER